MKNYNFITQFKAHIFSGYPVYLLLLMTVGIGFLDDHLWMITLISALILMFSNKTERKRVDYLMKLTNGANK